MSELSPEIVEISGRSYLARPAEAPAFGPIPRRPAVVIVTPCGTRYRVDTIPGLGHGCTCPDYRYRKSSRGAAGCKHIRALAAEGLIDPAEPARGASEAGPLGVWIEEAAALTVEVLARTPHSRAAD